GQCPTGVAETARVGHQVGRRQPSGELGVGCREALQPVGQLHRRSPRKSETPAPGRDSGRTTGVAVLRIRLLGRLRVTLLEALDAARGVDELLAAGEERVTGAADFQTQLLAGRVGLE